MKKLRLWIIVLLCLTSINVHSQQTQSLTFTPAQAQLKQYDALYVLNQADDKKIKGLLRNINNVLNDPRLKGKLHIEVIAFSDGVEMYKKANPYLPLLIALKEKGIVFVQCTNTINERKINKSDLFDFINYVPSGNGEIILRHYEGWAIVHP